MNKAIFLDRDGVINRKGSSYYIYREEEFIFNKGIFEALRYFISKGYLLIIITNQGGVARGIYTIEQLEKLHIFMKKRLSEQGIEIRAVYYCPHHPEISVCECRKPGSLLFEKAIEEFEIDRDASYMIGDSEADIIASEKAGVKGILVPVNANLMDILVSTGKI